MTKLRKQGQVLRLGGCGYKVLSLLEGRAHAYLFASPGCKKWDTCAPEALLKASGGRLTDLTGKPYSYFSDVKHGNDLGVLATPCASWHNAYVDCLRNSGIIDELTQI
ncbi:unnamed protein product [Protopolystoma xenopodis]|uniref:3'(2'),5'-bisphosphate nucleotidase 1 n=1 Tax=Protopolystoma xenopodis TaxID=117903 RepID=A0A3S5BWB7_9PLAT|nr:unnamed protein product [Protopolystoma xenopodis]